MPCSQISIIVWKQIEASVQSSFAGIC